MIAKTLAIPVPEWGAGPIGCPTTLHRPLSGVWLIKTGSKRGETVGGVATGRQYQNLSTPGYPASVLPYSPTYPLAARLAAAPPPDRGGTGAQDQAELGSSPEVRRRLPNPCYAGVRQTHIATVDRRRGPLYRSGGAARKLPVVPDSTTLNPHTLLPGRCQWWVQLIKSMLNTLDTKKANASNAHKPRTHHRRSTMMVSST